MPVGFWGSGPGKSASIGPGLTISPRSKKTSRATIAIATGRHRGVGSFPSGKSRRIQGIGNATRENTQFVSHAEKWTKKPSIPRGIAYRRYSSVKPPRRKPAPISIRSQPIALCSARLAISAPIVM